MNIERIHDASGNVVAAVGTCTWEDGARYFQSLDTASQQHIRTSTDPAAAQIYGPLAITQADGYAEAYPNGCEQYAQMSPDGRKQARKDLEVELRRVLTGIYGRIWTKGKIAVQASKMVDESMRAGNVASN